MTPRPAEAPLLSILVPGYNVERFITDCLKHIVAQMHARHELIVVDDGSTDATVARVRAVQAAHPRLRIRLVEQANQGIADARNRALREARGEYILFVDSDDRLLPRSLEALERVIAERHPDVIATALRFWHPDAPDKDRDVYMSYAPEQTITCQDAILTAFFRDRHMYVWCKVFRRAIYAQEAMPLFPSRRLFEDVAVVPRLLQRCRSLVYLPHVLLAYRQHPVSITRVISEQWCVDFASALAAVKPHFERAGVSAAVRAQFDVAACHFYIGLVKNSYQLPAAKGDAVRGKVRAIFLDSLFAPPRQVLADMAGAGRHDARTARQVRRALDGSRWFHLQQSAVRKLKLWQRLARTRALPR
ncbi:glycosyltransferase involved in cell wall biosynthesis [Duganella sp. SG902]|uniref:glycosyltransferase family 2 protein n=1 Tax=Duganella sp. SG902 TaxID=2587016 RepID=UPI00159D4BD1|nr:glycosyltransferase family A protein [Duganella sp. SG902]NVM75123.1 glycosyltransferase involved in cell wall biosynthesis [Duganella sp. SG902]